MVSDLFIALPRRFADSLYDALNLSLRQLEGGAGHRTYEPLVRDPRVGASNISFIDPGHYDSAQDVRHVQDTPMNGSLFLAVLRACPEQPVCAREPRLR